VAGGIPEYDELRLRFAPGDGDAYRVLAFGPDGSTAAGSFTSPFSVLELDNFVLRVGLPRRRTRSYGSTQMEEARRFGAQLFEALMQGEIGDAYVGARRLADAHDRGLRVTLQLSQAPELMEMPWEFLYDRPAFLSQSIYTPVVRSLDLKAGRAARDVTLPLRIVGVVSSPESVAQLDVAAEREKLERALGDLKARGMVELDWLPRATLGVLDRRIGAPDDVHVLHYIGHGTYEERAQSGLLMFEDEHGGRRDVTGEELCSMLYDERSLRLAVLNACEGARTSHVDPFSGVASSLMQCGIPAVVGMQFEITDDAAVVFSERFYTALAQGFPVDAALGQGRKAIFAAGNETEFGTPVLFLRGTDARLFDVHGPAEAPPSARPAEPPPAPIEPPRDLVGSQPIGGAPPPSEPALPAPDDNRGLFDGRVGELEGEVYPNQRKALRQRIAGDEQLLVMCRCGIPGEKRHVVLLLTTRQLIWARETAWSSATGGATLWSDVTSIVASRADGTLAIGTNTGLGLAFTGFNGDGVRFGAVDASLTAEGLADLMRTLTGAAAGETRPAEPWSVDVLQRADQVLELRIRLTEAEHMLLYRVGGWKDTLELDGRTLFSILWPKNEYRFTLRDGDRSLDAVCQIGLSVTGQKINRAGLEVDGRMLYLE
jgi:hypothetical protein